MDNPLKILVVEDSEDDYHLLLRELHKGGLSIDAHRVETGMELRNSLRNSWDLVISDNRLPFMNAPEALNITRCYDKDVPFLILSGTIGEEAAVEAMRAGANDYILKGNLARLIPVIEREVQQAKNRKTRKHTERSLLKSQKMYQFLTDSIDDSFLALNQELGIIHHNDTAATEFILPHGNAERLDIYTLFPNWKNSSYERKIHSVLKKLRSDNFSFEHNDGFYDCSVYPSEEGVSMICRNVTEHRTAEENLRKINNELETLMYRISHDLKGPVASILGLINIGKMDFKDRDVIEYLGMLDQSAFQLKNTLDELLNLSRIKRGQILLEEVLLSEVLTEIMNGLKYYDGFNEVDFELSLEDQYFVYSDKRLLTSIFQNILENAVKYRKTSRDHRSWVIVEASRQQNELHVVIRDNGQGISQSQQSKVFDMFYRAHEYASGSGLGLYIVKNALDKINGSIKLTSSLGKGSRFDVVLPDMKEIALD